MKLKMVLSTALATSLVLCMSQVQARRIAPSEPIPVAFQGLWVAGDDAAAQKQACKILSNASISFCRLFFIHQSE